MAPTSKGWHLKLTLDRCTLENLYMYGAAVTCTATSQCHYTYDTCEDQVNYDKGTKIFEYCSRGLKLSGAVPYLNNPSGALPTEINPDKFKTTRGNIRFELVADTHHKIADPDKLFDLAKASDAADTGNYWPNWLARNPAYRGRLAELYWYDGSTSTLKWRGIMDNIDWSQNGIVIDCLDLLWSATLNETPAKIPAKVVVDDNPLTDGATTINLDDGSGSYSASDHFESPDADSGSSTVNQYRFVKIENEIIAYTAISSDQLTGCVRGVMGSTAAAHIQGTAITQVNYYGEVDASDGDWDAVTGLPVDHILADLVVNLGGVSASYLEVDTGIDTQIDGNQLATATTITVSDIADLPGVGIIKVGSEFIRYTGKDGADLTGCKRGCYGTTPAALSDDDDVDVLSFSNDFGNWIQGFLYAARLEKPTKVNERINTIKRSVMADMWVNESGNVEGRINKPPLYSTTPNSYTEADWTKRTLFRNEEMRITRVTVYYDPSSADPGQSPDNYSAADVYIDKDAESSNSYNEVRDKVIYSEWIKDTAEATWLAAHEFTANISARPIIKFTTGLVNEGEKIADLIEITIPEVVDDDGAEDARFYKVIRKHQIKGGEVDYTVIDTGYGDNKYCLISSDSNDYDATSADKNVYGWIGNADNKLGAALDDGYLIF